MDGSGRPAPAPGETTSRPGPTGEDVDLLAAERAASRYWRSVAEQRRRDAARTSARPLVRAAVAIDRRAGARLDRAAAAARRAGPAALLAVRALPTLLHRPAPALPPAGPGPVTGSRVAVVALGTTPLLDTAGAVTVVDTAGGDGGDGLGDVDAVAVVGPTSRPLTPGWLARLADRAVDTGTAVAPVALHPRRHGLRRTPHDGRVRWAGLATRVVDDAPVPVAVAAGRQPHDLAGPPGAGPPADLVPATVLVVPAAAWRSVGGLRAHADPDAAVVDLCLRLREVDVALTVCPDVLVEDTRPVRRAAELTAGLDPTGPAWRAVVDDHGARLRRSAAPRGEGTTFALTTAVPSARLAERWGDWHLAQGLAAGLRRAGHPARCQVRPEADSAAGRAADVHLVVRGLEPVRRTTGQAHVLWVVSHPEALTVEECDEADLVLVASPSFAAHLRGLTSTPVEVLLQGTDHRRFRPLPADPAHAHPVTVVANRRGAPRRAVADALTAGLDPALYGSGWEGHVPDGVVVATHVPNHELPRVYGSAGVVLNDHWETMREWGFLSNRLFDVAACGTPVLSDDVPGLADVFGDLVATWASPAELAARIDHLRADPAAARARADDTLYLVREHHTLDVRAGELLAALARHGLSEARR